MRWECSECGIVVERESPPQMCEHCGLAGVIFVRSDEDAFDELGGVVGYWYESAAFPLEDIFEKDAPSE